MEIIKSGQIFLLADIHIGCRSNSLSWLNNCLDYFDSFYIPFLEQNKKEGDMLLILGDFFDNKQSLDIYVLNKSIDLVTKLSKILPVWFLTGNHDIYNRNNTNVNSLVIFNGIPNTRIITSPLTLKCNNSKYLLMPWDGDLKNENEVIKKSKVDIVFAHTTLNNMTMDNNCPILDGLETNTRIISGHIHKRQESRDKNKMYIGSPFEMKRSDKDNIKGVYILNTVDNTLSFKENNFSPKFKVHNLYNLLEMTVNEIDSVMTNCYNDIVVDEMLLNRFNIATFVDILKRNGVKFKNIEIVVGASFNAIDNNLINEDDNKSIKEIILENIYNMILDESSKQKMHSIVEDYWIKLSETNNDII